MVRPALKDKWEVVIEIDTFDGDPRYWDWRVFFPDDEVKIKTSRFVEVVREDGDEI